MLGFSCHQSGKMREAFYESWILDDLDAIHAHVAGGTSKFQREAAGGDPRELHVIGHRQAWRRSTPVPCIRTLSPSRCGACGLETIILRAASRGSQGKRRIPSGGVALGIHIHVILGVRDAGYGSGVCLGGKIAAKQLARTQV